MNLTKSQIKRITEILEEVPAPIPPKFELPIGSYAITIDGDIIQVPATAASVNAGVNRKTEEQAQLCRDRMVKANRL